MNLSKHRLLQIIREEIATITESPSLGDLQKQRSQDALATTRRGKENLASRGLDFGVQGGPDVEGTITPGEMKGVVGASTPGEKAQEKEEDAGVTQRLASLRTNEASSLEQTIREEIEAYLAEERDLPDWARPGPYRPDPVRPTPPEGSRAHRDALRSGADAESAVADLAFRPGSSTPPGRRDDDSFSKAGEEIEKKGTEGVFTAKAKSAGMGVQAYADKVLAKDSKASTKTKRQAAFAKGAATVARENK